MTDQAEAVHFDGACPFLTCLRTQAHDHPVCPDCGAVRHGNLFCATCRTALERQPRTVEVDEL